ncbi:hypothetical protein ACIRSS_09145 [Amycolatopsis sp. NPDC101161]|uniref:hypothetical protein n=1 Tax=Amycolatopsis sp. NPDC101161 TaxID=3363940 RepID=UPI00380BC8DB
MTRTPVFTTGYVLCVVLGLFDVVGVAGLAMDDAPPAVVVILGGVLGLVTLAAAVPAWRGNRAGQLTVAGSRALSGLLAVPAFFVDAPAWARLLSGGLILLTIVGVGLLLSGARRPAMAR